MHFVIGWPQAIILIWMALAVGLEVGEGNGNGFKAFVMAAVFSSLLYWGGFFT